MGYSGLILLFISFQLESSSTPCAQTLKGLTTEQRAAKQSRIEEAWDSYLRAKSTKERQLNRNILWEHYFVELYEKMRPRLSLRKLHPSLTEDDLKSEFAMALLKCLENYDPTSQTKFETFCSTPLAFVISNLKRYHKPLGNRASARRAKIYSQAVFNLKSQGKSPPTEEELRQEVMLQLAASYSFEDAEALETETKLTIKQGPGNTTISLEDESFKDAEGRVIFEPSYDSEAESDIELEDFLNELLEGLPIRDQIIVRLLVEGYSQAEISAELKKRGAEILMSAENVNLEGVVDSQTGKPAAEVRIEAAKKSLAKSKTAASQVKLDQRDWLLLSLRQLDIALDGSSTRKHDSAETYLNPGEPITLNEFIESVEKTFTDRNLTIIRLALQGYDEAEISVQLKEKGFRKPRLPLKDILKQEIMPDLERKLEDFQFDRVLQRHGFDVSESRISQLLTKEIAPKIQARLQEIDSTLVEKIKKMNPSKGE